jgi:hypothetical protein
MGPGAAGFEIRIVGSDGQQVAMSSGEHSTGLRVCATDTRGSELVAELRALAGASTALLTAHLVDPRAKENAGKPR